MTPSKDVRLQHVEVLVEHEEAGIVLFRRVEVDVEPLAVRRDVLDAGAAVVAVVNKERLAYRLERLGIEFAEVVSAKRFRRIARRAEAHVQHAVHARDAVGGAHELGRADLLQVLVPHVDAPALRHVLRDAHRRVELAVPVADVALVLVGRNVHQQMPVPVELVQPVVERRVDRVGRHAEALHVPAALRERAGARQDRLPVRRDRRRRLRRAQVERRGREGHSEDDPVHVLLLLCVMDFSDGAR